MSSQWTKDLESIISGPLLKLAGPESLRFQAVLCDLRPRFIPKCRVGRGYRAVSRNGRVLLATNSPMDELIEREVEIRLQPWRKVILPGQRPEIYGVLMCTRCLDSDHLSGLKNEAAYDSCLVKEAQSAANLAVDVGGGMSLLFFPRIESTHKRYV